MWCKEHNPKEDPFCELGTSLADRFPGGRTQTQHPKVQRLVKSLTILVARVRGDISDALVGISLCNQRA